MITHTIACCTSTIAWEKYSACGFYKAFNISSFSFVVTYIFFNQTVKISIYCSLKLPSFVFSPNDWNKKCTYLILFFFLSCSTRRFDDWFRGNLFLFSKWIIILRGSRKYENSAYNKTNWYPLYLENNQGLKTFSKNEKKSKKDN